MLSAIGETLETTPQAVSGPADTTTELITGVIMSARANFYRIAIWTRKADDPAAAAAASTQGVSPAEDLLERLMSIGRKFKVDILGFPLEQKLGSGLMSDVEFQSHTESEKKKGRKITL